MGYTHYWYGQVTFDEALIADIFMLLFAADVELSGGTGAGLPEVTREFVRFNGSLLLGESHEAFAVHDGMNDSCCKTADYPYDSVVCAVLLRIQHYNPHFAIESDGTWEADWQAGRDIYARTYAMEPVRPTRV